MKAFRHSFLTLFFFIFYFYTYAQATLENERFPVKEIDEIIELYKAGLYNVIKSKLGNRGFKLENEVPDYTLNKLSYSGQFDFEKEFLISKEYGFSVKSYYRFKTIEYSNSATEFLIEISVLSKDSYQAFNYLRELWIKNKKYSEYEPQWCSGECFIIGYMRKVFCITEENFTPDFELNPFGLILWWENSITPKPKDGEKEKKFFVGENDEIELLNLELGKDKTSLFGKYYFRKLNNKVNNIQEFLDSN